MTRVIQWLRMRTLLLSRHFAQKDDVLVRRSRRVKGATTTSRQQGLPYWNQQQLESSTVVNVGAGGAGGELCLGQVRKGVGSIHVLDGDVVEATNLNRQFFTAANIGENKARALVKRLAREGCCGSQLLGHPHYYDASRDTYLEQLRPDVLTVSIDRYVPNARASLSLLATRLRIPTVFLAISDDADWGYVFVQEPGLNNACWGCVIRENESGISKRCPGTVGATVDPLKMLAGLALYAVDSLIMGRPRDWNYRALSLSRSDVLFSTMAPRRLDCQLCGSAKQ